MHKRFKRRVKQARTKLMKHLLNILLIKALKLLNARKIVHVLIGTPKKN